MAVIIRYDNNPNLTADQKLLSLAESIQLAFNEVEAKIETARGEIEKLKEYTNDN